jgi:hypothetical protein
MQEIGDMFSHFFLTITHWNINGPCVTKICVLPFYKNKSMSYCVILGDVQFFFNSVVIGH